MSHQDVESRAVTAWITEVLHGSFLNSLTFRKDARWSPLRFVATALLWATGESRTLSDRFELARQQALTLPFDETSHEHRGASYQAFMKLLVRWSDLLILFLLHRTHQRMMQTRGFVHDCGFVVFGVDGSRIAVPRTVANEQQLAPGLNPACRLRGARREQARIQAEIPSFWLTMLWHVGLGLPWRWRLGPSNASERDHLRTLAINPPEHSLITADAGFAGYDYWKLLLEQGVHFIIRVGSGIQLLSELGDWQQQDDRVWLWPERAARQQQPPLKLRLVEIKTSQQSIWLVTSVLSHGRLSDAQVGQLYRERWGVEVFFRDFKETLGKRKLLSRTPEHARLELHWSLLGLLLLLFNARLHQQIDPDPGKTSTSGVLRVLRRSLRGLYPTFTQLLTALRNAVVDSYVRKRKSRRTYPQRKAYTPPGKPRLKKPPPQLNHLAHTHTPITLTSYG